MNQEKEQTETEESICEFCQTEVYEIEHDCLDRDPRTGQGPTKFDSLGPIRSVHRRSVDPCVKSKYLIKICFGLNEKNS